MTGLGIPPQEHAVLIERLLTLLTSCDERRFGQWELQSWWEFVGAEQRSEAFRKFLAEGLTRTLVAARAREISARTGGLILAQLVFDLTRAGGRADRVLDAPTNEAWIDPWVAHLRGLGVELRLDAPVQGLTVKGGRIAGATTPAGTVTADYYVAALPVEVMRSLAGPPLRAAGARLDGLDRLVTRWMNGILFYLDRDVPLVNGHAIYIDSQWALTSISQAQFWTDVDLARYGDGRVKGILSVDVSDWQTPGPRTGKVAMRCTTRGDPRRGVGPARPTTSRTSSTSGTCSAWFLDPAITFPNPTDAANLEPLLINTAGSWADRPGAGDEDPQPAAGRRLRAHEHGPGDDGGRERGGAARGQRDPRPQRARPGRGAPSSRCPSRGVLQARAGAGPDALAAVPPARADAAAGAPRRRAGAERAAGAGDARRRPAHPSSLTRLRPGLGGSRARARRARTPRSGRARPCRSRPARRRAAPPRR